ncbi:glucose-6-phosphate isomerase [Mycoplasmoides genitalium]
MSDKLLTIDLSHVYGFDKEIIFKKYQKKVDQIHQDFLAHKLADGHMTGWYDQPDQNHQFLLKTINQIDKKFKSLKVTDIVYVGIGGSFTGIKTVLDFLKPKQRTGLKIHFVPDLSAFQAASVIKEIKNKSWALIITSKSGRTLEPALNFRIFRNLLNKRYGNKHYQRVVVITDEKKGLLTKMASNHGYQKLVIDSNIGGRFSTLSPAGLLLAKLFGHDPKAILKGTLQAKKDLQTTSLENNSAYLYAVVRHWLYTTKKFKIEVCIAYHSLYEYLLLQHRQLFGESEGKNDKSLFPTFSIFTVDLHSMGQLYQEGEKVFFETVIDVKNPLVNINLPPSDFDNDDELDFLLDKSLNEISDVAIDSVIKAHYQANVSIIKLTLKEQSAFMFGYFYFWLSVATVMSGSLLGHNVFNQPGVEVYKKLMFEKLRSGH